MGGVSRFFGAIQRRPSTLCVVLLTITILVPFIPTLVKPGGRVFGAPDCDSPKYCHFIYPYVANCWLSGEIPLWDPWTMLGIPLTATTAAGLFHPLTAAFFFLPTGPSINWTIALCFVATGLSFWGYLRALGLGRTASSIGALTWAFSSAHVGRVYAGHLPILLCSASLPLILMFWEFYRADAKTWYLAAISLSFACLILAAHPMYPYIYGLFTLLYVAVQSLLNPRTFKRVPMLLIALLLGAGCASVYLLPCLDFATESFRIKNSMDLCGVHSFAPLTSLTVLCPEFFGKSKYGPDQYWGFGYLWEAWMYIGILPLLASITGIITTSLRQKILLVTAAVVFMVMALGRFTPLYPIFYNYLPFFKLFRAPGRYADITVFCLVVLSAIGFETWIKGFGTGVNRIIGDQTDVGENKPCSGDAMARRRDRSAFWLTFVGSLVILGILMAIYVATMPQHPSSGSRWQSFVQWVCARAGSLSPTIDYQQEEVLARTGASAAAQLVRAVLFTCAAIVILFLAKSGRLRKLVGTAILAVLLADLGSFARSFLVRYDGASLESGGPLLPRAAPNDYPIRGIDPSPYPNRAAKYGFSSVGGYSANTLLRYNTFLNAVTGRSLDTDQCQAAVGQLPERYYNFLSVEYAPSANRLLKHDGAFPRAFLAENPQFLDSSAKALKYICSDGVNLLKCPAVEVSPQKLQVIPVGEKETVRLLEFSVNRVVLEVQARTARILILNEMYGKNWCAKVNGAKVVLYPGNYLFRAVKVPEGKSVVVFNYFPRSFLIGLIVSLLSLIAIVFVWVSPHFISCQSEENPPARCREKRMI